MTGRLSLGGGVAALLLVSAVLVLDRPAGARPAPSLVRARTIELVDPQGKVRAQLKVEASGEVVLRLRDEDGRIRVKLGASRAGSGLLLLDESNEPGVHAVAGTETSLTVQRGERRNVLSP